MVIDYRSGAGSIIQDLRGAAKQHGKLVYAFDAVSEKGSYVNICEVLDRQTGQITLVLPRNEYLEIPSTITKSVTSCGSVFEAMDQDSWEKKVGTKTGNQEFGYVMFRLFGRGLARGWFKGQPHEIVPGGLNGLEDALTKLKEGKASAVKYVLRISDTPGLQG